jgi:ubiquinone/menaquinone biosynthesis C-methylase UbiE
VGHWHYTGLDLQMSRTHQSVVSDQFGPRAEAYVASAVHSRGEDLDRIEAAAQRIAPRRAIDLGTGGGHVAYRLACHAEAVTACDLSEQMLAAVAKTAAAKGLGNIETVQTAAERLPFEDGTFDFLACRFSAHHWHDWEAGLREARRVLKPGASAIFVDVISPGGPMLDTHLQAVELLRDPSHVRDYSSAEWQESLTRSRFAVGTTRTWRIKTEFAVWIARMQTPPVLADAIRALQQAAPAEVVRHFAIEPDGTFMLDCAMFEVTAG